MNDYINKNDLIQHQQKLAKISHAQKRFDISHYKKTCPSIKFLLDTSNNGEVFNLTKETKKLRDSVSATNQHQTCQTTSFNKTFNLSFFGLFFYEKVENSKIKILLVRQVKRYLTCINCFEMPTKWYTYHD